ncbi:MAG: ferrous iron transport protein A [Kiritimatiellae bacterium]|nr:ferrous iron transport protein A [Kiritimatiellia bacterium]
MNAPRTAAAPRAATSATSAGTAEDCALNVARSGHEVVIRTIHSGREMRGRLAALGLMSGVRVRVVRAGRRNPTVIALQGARIVLGRGMAERIEVRPVVTEGAARRHG